MLEGDPIVPLMPNETMNIALFNYDGRDSSEASTQVGMCSLMADFEALAKAALAR